MSLVSNLPASRQLLTLVSVIAACAATLSGDSNSGVRPTPESVVKQYCQKDFDGARTSSKTYSQMEHLFLWPDEPGWDTVTVVKSYRIIASKLRGNIAVVTVEYQSLGEIAAWEFREENKSERVKFTLELGSKEWVWKKDEPVLAASKLAWRITDPIMQPHISIPYAIKHFTWLVQTQHDPDHQLDKVLARLKAIQ